MLNLKKNSFFFFNLFWIVFKSDVKGGPFFIKTLHAVKVERHLVEMR